MRHDRKSAPWVCGLHERICDQNKSLRFYPGLAVGNAFKHSWGTLKDAKASDDRSHPGHNRGLRQRGDGVEKENQKIGSGVEGKASMLGRILFPRED
jgi:hypothetical protein